MRSARLMTRFSALLFGAALLVSCTDGADPAALGPNDPSFASSGPVLVECPVEYEVSTTGELGATGGTIRLHDHELSVPAQALTRPQGFRMVAPVSSYMELSVHPGQGGPFEFKKPVTITIDYSRCSRSNIDKAPLTVWQIDPDTKALLENMGGVDHKESRTVSFTTDHLSTFSIAQ